MPRPTLEDLQLAEEAPLLLRSLQLYLRRAFVTCEAGGGRDPRVSIQFRELSDAQGFHGILVDLMKQPETAS